MCSRVCKVLQNLRGILHGAGIVHSGFHGRSTAAFSHLIISSCFISLVLWFPLPGNPVVLDVVVFPFYRSGVLESHEQFLCRCST